MERSKPLYRVRSGKDEDRNFVLATMSKGILGQPPFNRMSRPAWDRYHDRLEALVDRCQRLVAVSYADDDHMMGYIVFEDIGGESVVHYLYVKAKFRGALGIEDALLQEALSLLGDRPSAWYSHNVSSLSGAHRRQYLMAYDPYLVT